VATPEDLGVKLDILIRLMALQIIGERTGVEAITVLTRARLDNEIIADLVGTSEATVRATRSRVRRAGGRG
jgi:hypothetical protein